MKSRLGTIECINIIRQDYFKREISKIIQGKVNMLMVGGGYGDSLEDYYRSGLRITFTDFEQCAVEYVKKSMWIIILIFSVVQHTICHLIIMPLIWL